MTRTDIEREIRRRADFYLPQTHLAVHYYRIRRRIAYPLPIRQIQLPSLPVPGLPNYPWATWMTWELEERIGSLGWAGTWFGDQAARQAASRDIEALAGWPCYRQYPHPDLSLGHGGRTLWAAYAQWDWLGQELRRKIEGAFERVVSDALPLSDERHGAFSSKEDILALKEPHSALHNIPFIGAVAVALAARAVAHPAAEKLDRRLRALLGAILDLRARGHSEGAAYDGYILDFAMSWLQTLPEPERSPILDHPRFRDFLDESLSLAAPGDLARVAELSDVEPREMPFHITAHARTYAMRPDPTLAWYLKRCRIDHLRADALSTLRPVADGLNGHSPPAGALDAHYALMLRSGWEAEDLAVAVAASNSPMGHIQRDSGSLVVGTRGRWLVADPGYQQYMKKQEREFTLGAAAHNAPVINGKAQTEKLRERRPALTDLGAGLYRADLDLTACYPEDLRLTSVLRTVWLSGKALVIVADRVRGEAVESLTYHWHGDAEAAWWVADNWARICLPQVTLHVTSPQTILTSANVDRLPGSRGQLTLCARADIRAPVVWWVFAIGDDHPEARMEGDGQGISIGGRAFRVV